MDLRFAFCPFKYHPFVHDPGFAFNLWLRFTAMKSAMAGEQQTRLERNAEKLNSGTVSQQIQELEALRAQKRYWSIGITAVLLLIVVGCLFRLRSAVTGLTNEGPIRAQFASDFSNRLQQDVLPNVEQMATQAVREVDYGAEVQKLNQRTPELTQASLQQMRLLADNLAKRGEKVLDNTFQTELKAQEKAIRADFPEATDEQVSKLMTALTTEAKTRAAEVNTELFSPHQKALNNIVQQMRTIQNSEPSVSKADLPTWQMGLMIFDIARADLKDVEPTSDTAATSAPRVKGAKK